MIRTIRFCSQKTNIPKRLAFFLTQICCIWVVLLAFSKEQRGGVVTALEASWTPSEDGDDGSGPLPLSNNVRQQLLQLEETIRKSPDPQATLEQVAQSNNMSPQELVNMMERNRRDLQQGGGVAGGSRPVSILTKLISAMGIAITQAASKNPKAFVVATTSLLLLLILIWNIPRNGIVLSTNRAMLLSKGPTTVFAPPNRYVTKLLNSPPPKWRLSSSFQKQEEEEEEDERKNDIRWILSKELSTNNIKQFQKQLQQQGEGGIWYNKPAGKQSNFLQAVTYQISVPMNTFVDDDDDGNDDDDEFMEQVLDLSFQNAVNVLSTHSLTEFVPPSKQIRLHSHNENAILVVKKLGDYRRYGLVPMQLTHELSSSSSEESVTPSYTTIYTFLKGAPWVGQMHVSVRQQGSNSLGIQVSIVVPKKMDDYGLIGVDGRKCIHKKLAYGVVEGIAKSIASSVRTRTKQSVSRRQQSNRFQTKASGHANYRRNVRYQKEKELEEMATDRRRKWQRGNNSNGGRYVPSGERMRSPNNC